MLFKCNLAMKSGLSSSNPHNSFIYVDMFEICNKQNTSQTKQKHACKNMLAKSFLW